MLLRPLPAIVAAALLLPGPVFMAAAEDARGRENQPPVLDFNIPLQAFLDSTNSNRGYRLLNLSKYFSDDGGDGNLSYCVVYSTNVTHICATVDGWWLSFTTPTRGWYGQERFRVRATDAGGLWTESNNFTVRVTLDDEPLSVSPLPEIEVTAEREWFFDLSGYVHNLDGPLSSLKVTADSGYVRGDGLGLFLKYPASVDNSEYTEHVFLTITSAIETCYAATNVIVHPPGFWRELPSGLRTVLVTFGTVYLENLSVIKPSNETPPGNLVWNLSGVQPGEPPAFEAKLQENGTVLSIRSLGVFGVGTFSMSASLHGETVHSDTVSVLIVPVELEPYATAVEDITVKEHGNVSVRLAGGYPGGGLTFWTNSTFLNITADGWMNFTPDQDEVGRWRIAYRVSVKDAPSEYVRGEFNLTVVNVNEPPEFVAILKPALKARTVEGRALDYEANATDPDGDALEYTWFEDGRAFARGKAPGRLELPAGTHTVRVRVSDGEFNTTSAPVEITVEPWSSAAGRSVPLTAMFLLSGLALGVGGFIWSRRKRP